MGIYIFDRNYLLRDTGPQQGKRSISACISCPGQLKTTMSLPIRSMATGEMSARSRPTGKPTWICSSHGDLISPEKWQIRTNIEAEGRRADRPAARYFSTARVQNSLISAGCMIKGTVINSVLSPGVVVEEGAVVKDSISSGIALSTKKGPLTWSFPTNWSDLGKARRWGRRTSRYRQQALSQASLYRHYAYRGVRPHPARKKIGRNCIVGCMASDESFSSRFCRTVSRCSPAARRLSPR